MTALTICVRVLEGIFVAGSVGSALVLMLTGVEDLKTLFGGKSRDAKETPAT